MAVSSLKKFTLPTMPFHRDVDNGCQVGTNIVVNAKAYNDVNKTVLYRLATSAGDVALRITMDLNSPTKMRMDCMIGGKPSSPIEHVVAVSLDKPFKLSIKSLQHSFQIVLNGSRVADFVHRVDPVLIRKMSIEGPIICEEVLVDTSALPTYEQATSGASVPVDMMRSLNLGSDGLPSKKPSNYPTNPSAPGYNTDDFPPPPSNHMNSTSTTSTSFFYQGGSQGFSEHPFPLPGMIDHNTYSSQQNETRPLPTTVAPSTVPISTTTTSTSAPYVTSTTDTSRFETNYQPTVTSPTPYTVTYPQTPLSTPAASAYAPPPPAAAYQNTQMPQYPPQQQPQYPTSAQPQYPTSTQPQYPTSTQPQYPTSAQPQYPPQPGSYPYPQQQYPSQPYNRPMTQMAPPYPQQQQAVVPTAVPATVPMAYPGMSPYVQPVVGGYMQPYVQPYAYPAYYGGVYEVDYYPHHHHHRHHHC